MADTSERDVIERVARVLGDAYAAEKPSWRDAAERLAAAGLLTSARPPSGDDVERAAEAAYATYAAPGPHAWAGVPEHGKQQWRAIAVAVVAALTPQERHG